MCIYSLSILIIKTGLSPCTLVIDRGQEMTIPLSAQEMQVNFLWHLFKKKKIKAIKDTVDWKYLF